VPVGDNRNAAHLVRRQHGGDAPAHREARDSRHPGQLFAEHLKVEKEGGATGLLVGGCRDCPLIDECTHLLQQARGAWGRMAVRSGFSKTVQNNGIRIRAAVRKSGGWIRTVARGTGTAGARTVRGNRAG